MDLDKFFEEVDFEAIAEKNDAAQEADTKAAAELGSDADCEGCKI